MKSTRCYMSPDFSCLLLTLKPFRFAGWAFSLLCPPYLFLIICKRLPTWPEKRLNRLATFSKGMADSGKGSGGWLIYFTVDFVPLFIYPCLTRTALISLLSGAMRYTDYPCNIVQFRLRLFGQFSCSIGINHCKIITWY